MPENFMPHALYHENSQGNAVDSYGRPMFMVNANLGWMLIFSLAQ